MLTSEQLQKDFLYDLYHQSTVEGKFSVFDKYIKRLGFEAAVYSVMPRLQYESNYYLDPVFISSAEFSKKFLDHYSEGKLSEDDFTIRKINDNFLDPLDWREHEKLGLVSPNELDLIKLARVDYGITNAISVPTMNAEAGFSGASIVSSDKDTSFQKLLREKQYDLKFITYRFHQAIMEGTSVPAEFVKAFIDHFSPNEIGIICHLAAGKPYKNAVDTVDVNSSKSAYHALSNLRKNKFRHKISRDRLLYLSGLIDISRFETTPHS